MIARPFPPPRRPAPATAASTPIGSEPWKGLTVLRVDGDGTWADQMTRYCVSIVNVDPLSAVGHQTDWERDGRSKFTLRFEWASTNPNTNSRATGAWIYLRYPDGGDKIGSVEWQVAMNEAATGVATKTVHLDTDPMNGTIDVPLWAGEVEMYLYLEKNIGGVIKWSADSRGGAWGEFPKNTFYARGHLNALYPGCMIGWHDGGDPHSACDDLPGPDREFCKTDAMGKRCAAVRIYSSRWERPPSSVGKTLYADALPMWSVKPPRSGGWRAVAEGTANNPYLFEIIDALKAYNQEIIFIFHHEPHDDVNGSTNTAYWYRQAVLRIKNRLLDRGAHHSVGGNVYFGYGPTLWHAKMGKPIGSADAFYPGTGVFDLFCPTSYNWYNWNAGDGRWNSYETIMREGVALARQRGEKFFPSETGSHPSAAGFSRDQWLREASGYMRFNDEARSVFVGFAYFGVRFEDDGEWHDWTLFEKDGHAGYRDGFATPDYFKSLPFTLK